MHTYHLKTVIILPAVIARDRTLWTRIGRSFQCLAVDQRVPIVKRTPVIPALGHRCLTQSYEILAGLPEPARNPPSPDKLGLPSNERARRYDIVFHIRCTASDVHNSVPFVASSTPQKQEKYGKPLKIIDC